MEDEVNDLKSNIDQLTLKQGNERKAWEEKMESKDKLIEEYKNENHRYKSSQRKPNEAERKVLERKSRVYHNKRDD